MFLSAQSRNDHLLLCAMLNFMPVAQKEKKSSYRYRRFNVTSLENINLVFQFTDHVVYILDEQ